MAKKMSKAGQVLLDDVLAIKAGATTKVRPPKKQMIKSTLPKGAFESTVGMGSQELGPTTKILGLDPGLSGALALRFENEIEVFDIPTHTITVNRKKKRQIDLYAFSRWIDVHRNTIKYAVIENPHSMPKQGVTSAFNFGFTCGVAQAMIASALIPIHLVRPAKWKKQMGLSKDKDACRLRASERFPKYSELWKLVKHDGRAEATLLTLYTPETPFF